jgi:hypothetical protein
MVKRILAFALILSMAASFAAVKVERVDKRIGNKIDSGSNSKAVTWTGTLGSTFDKGGNGYGWYQGYNRKIQTNFDQATGTATMVGSIYRQLNAAGSGSVGGMVGTWGTAYEGFAQELYIASPYTQDGLPGGRYPYSCEFINGYFFGLFNDYNVPVSSTDSHAMFAVADATFGWDESYWSEPTRAEAVESGATPPGVWTGIGDVVYNPADGYYYWAHNWIYDGLSIDGITSCITGRSQTPIDPASWEWTDYHELAFDATNDTGDLTQLDNFYQVYCKDIYGNGTGYGIGVGMFTDKNYVMTNAAGDTLDVVDQPRLGYIYTTNWGADWSTGDFKSNWITPNNEGNNLFTADIYKLFDWYGDILLGDSIGVDGDGNAIYQEYPLNWPYMTWNLSAVATENNIVHVLIKAIPMSTESTDYWWPLVDGESKGGYYDVVGEITPDGVNWIRASYIASYMGLDDGLTEWKYSNSHDMSIGYAGHGVVYASWIDRPEARFTVNPNSDPNKEYIDDAYFTYSPDDGRTWDINKTVVYNDGTESYNIYYAANVTKTGALQDEGFSISTHGTNDDGTMTVYAACQYYDPANPLPECVDWFDYQQFYKVWRIKGTPTGIETEEVSMVKDFVLEQNYPNPFNPATEIRFALQNDSKVKLSVYNTKGELVANLKSGKMAKGAHKVSFDASALNSGVYFYKLDVNGMAETRKMVLTK